MPPLDRAESTSVGDGSTEGGSEPEADCVFVSVNRALEGKTFAVVA